MHAGGSYTSRSYREWGGGNVVEEKERKRESDGEGNG
jgi:hypothetical protein